MRSAVVVTGPLSKGFFSLGNCTLKSVLPLVPQKLEKCKRTEFPPNAHFTG